MARLQLALNVSDLDAAVDFYGHLLDAAPHKRRPGYANFEVADPPLKLVLFEVGEEAGVAGGTLNHLGVEVDSTDQVRVAADRLGSAGLPIDVREQDNCCHAVMDKVWTAGPDAERWEYYVITDDAPAPSDADPCGDGACATPSAAPADVDRELPLACC